jgi:hypothetical protein
MQVADWHSGTPLLSVGNLAACPPYGNGGAAMKYAVIGATARCIQSRQSIPRTVALAEMTARPDQSLRPR